MLLECRAGIGQMRLGHWQEGYVERGGGGFRIEAASRWGLGSSRNGFKHGTGAFLPAHPALGFGLEFIFIRSTEEFRDCLARPQIFHLVFPYVRVRSLHQLPWSSTVRGGTHE